MVEYNLHGSLPGQPSGYITGFSFFFGGEATSSLTQGPKKDAFEPVEQSLLPVV